VCVCAHPPSTPRPCVNARRGRGMGSAHEQKANAMRCRGSRVEDEWFLPRDAHDGDGTRNTGNYQHSFVLVHVRILNVTGSISPTPRVFRVASTGKHDARRNHAANRARDDGFASPRRAWHGLPARGPHRRTRDRDALPQGDRRHRAALGMAVLQGVGSRHPRRPQADHRPRRISGIRGGTRWKHRGSASNCQS